MTDPKDSRRDVDGAVPAPDADHPVSEPPVRSRIPGIAFLRTHRQGVRRATACGVAAVAAASVLFVTGGSLPQGGSGASYADTPLRPYAGSSESVAGAENVTVAQVLDVLERAHDLAVQQGAALDPEIAQAAAELGMLYTTYQAQQTTGPAASAGDLAGGDGQEPVHGPSADPAGAVPGGDQSGVDDDGGGLGTDDFGILDPSSATKVSRTFGLGARPIDDLGPSGTGEPQIETRDHEVVVAFEDVVAAAYRLAGLMDPLLTDALVVPVPANGGSAASGLRENLVSIVDSFGMTTAGFANGRIPLDVLCPLDFAPGHRLRCDAAERLSALNDEYEKRFGRSIPMTDSYRPYASQVDLKRRKPYLAAPPGTSNHGWGIAVDLGSPISTGRSAEYTWMRVNAPDYGWDNPSWARLDGSKPEPWHFEFFAAGAIPNRAVDVTDVGAWEDPRYKPPLRQKPGDEPAAVPVNDNAARDDDDPSKNPGGDTPPSSKPPQPQPQPDEPTDEPGGKPTEPGDKPDPKPSPSDPGDEPTEPGDGSTEPGDEPSEPGTEPTEPGDEPGTEPTEPGTEPTEPGTEPTEPGTEPTEPGDEPSEPGTEPTEPGAEPTEPGDEPSGGSTQEPGDEPSEPSSDEPGDEPSGEPTGDAGDASDPAPSPSGAGSEPSAPADEPSGEPAAEPTDEAGPSPSPEKSVGTPTGSPSAESEPKQSGADQKSTDTEKAVQPSEKARPDGGENDGAKKGDDAKAGGTKSGGDAKNDGDAKDGGTKDDAKKDGEAKANGDAEKDDAKKDGSKKADAKDGDAEKGKSDDDPEDDGKKDGSKKDGDAKNGSKKNGSKKDGADKDATDKADKGKKAN